RVLYAGRVAHDELAPCVATFTVGVMPDSNEYGSPMKIFEYMAAGKPVIGPDYGPLLDVIEEGKQGFIFSRGQVESLAQCLRQVLCDEELANSMGRNARDYVIKERNWINNARLVMARLEHN
ncbi:TPA: glycosyltransferase, partial [Candidatus Micrarchaeota archaeon]|nr:glycosyltransferase [Candidatus Micrarchaeota archaeon]